MKKTYSGNPFILKNIAINIEKTFNGNIRDFINFGSRIFNGVEDFLDDLFDCLGKNEIDVMYWLAIYQYPINIFELNEIIKELTREQLIIIVKHLKLRFLVEGEVSISLPPMIQEYLVNRFVKEACQEIISGKLCLLSRFPLLITTARRIVKKYQEGIIQKNIIKRLINELGIERRVKDRLYEVIKIQSKVGIYHGYESGNIVNLMLKLKFDFKHKDFSDLVLKNVNFEDIDLSDTNLRELIYPILFS